MGHARLPGVGGVDHLPDSDVYGPCMANARLPASCDVDHLPDRIVHGPFILCLLGLVGEMMSSGVFWYLVFGNYTAQHSIGAKTKNIVKWSQIVLFMKIKLYFILWSSFQKATLLA